MVDVRMRNHHGVDVGDAPRPKIFGDNPGRPLGRTELAGVVKQRLAGWQFQHRGRAMSNRKERAVQAIGIVRNV